jgi:hypothetical protein
MDHAAAVGIPTSGGYYHTTLALRFGLVDARSERGSPSHYY